MIIQFLICPLTQCSERHTSSLWRLLKVNQSENMKCVERKLKAY